MENKELQQLLHLKFDYVDGELVFKSTKRKGKTAGWINNMGYKAISLLNKNYLAHRLIWLYHYGTLPKMIDHIDRNKLNNRIDNLRETNYISNLHNTDIRKNNKVGVKNVRCDKRYGGYEVIIRINNKIKYFGHYKELEKAKFIANEINSHYLNFENADFNLLLENAKSNYMKKFTNVLSKFNR